MRTAVSLPSATRASPHTRIVGEWQQQDWALLISVLAFVAATVSAGFTGWQGWSSHKARKEAEKQTALAEQALEHEREERNLFLQAQERDQASKVSAWCRDDYAFHLRPGYYTDAVISPGQADSDWSYHLRNASDATVHDVIVLFRQGGKHSLGTDVVDTLPPNSEPLTRKIPDHVKREARAAEKEHGQTIRPLVSFRDAAGRRWQRELDGRLTWLD